MAALDNQTIIQLRAKRDEIQDSIGYLEGKLTEARADLIHVNAVLRLFEIDPNERQQFPAHINLSRMFARGELLALCREALRRAGGPLTTRDLSAFVMIEKAWDQNDPVLRKSMTHRLVHTLTRSLKRGKIASPGYEKGVRV